MPPGMTWAALAKSSWERRKRLSVELILGASLGRRFQIDAQPLHDEVQAVGQGNQALHPDPAAADGSQSIDFIAHGSIGDVSVGKHDAYVGASRRHPPARSVVG